MPPCNPSRLWVFHSLYSDAYYSRVYALLSMEEINECRQWILAHDHLDSDQFAHEINRMGLGVKMDKKTRRRMDIKWELISVANSKHRERGGKNV